MRNMVFGIFLIGTILVLWKLPSLRFSVDHHTLLDPGSPEVKFWNTTEDTFSGGDEVLMVGITASGSLLSKENLRKQDQMTRSLDSISGISQVSSLTNVPFLTIEQDSAWAVPFYHHPGTDSAWFDSLRFVSYPDVYPKFLSEDMASACLYVFYPPLLPLDEKKRIADEAKVVVNRHFPNQPVIYSPSVLQDTQNHEMKHEAWKLGLVSAIVCLFLVWSVFRAFSATLFPMMIISLTVIWALGLMAWIGFAITPVSLSIPGVLAVVSLSDIIHILSAIQDVPPGQPLGNRVQTALHEMRRPVSFTSLTTFLGFFMLSFTGVPPVQEYGLVACAGVVISWMLSLLLVPNLLVISGQGVPVPVRNRGSWIQPVIRWVASAGRPWLVIGVFLIILSVSAVFSLRVTLDSPLYEDISRKDDLGAIMRFFEERFSGIRTATWVVEPAGLNQRLTDPEPMRQLGQLEDWVGQVYHTQEVYSPATEVRRIWRAMHQGNPDMFRIPGDAMVLKKFRKELNTYYDTLGLGSCLTRDHRIALVTAKMHDFGSMEADQLLQKMDSACKSGLFPSLKITPTGMPYLIDQSAKGMLDQLRYGLLLEVLLVGFLWYVQTRSPRMTLIALVPNLLPMVFLLGMMGAMDIPLKFSTMSVFTVIFGISVDDTIHYLHRYRKELAKSGMRPAGAAKRATLACGKPMVLTTLTLVAGFGVMGFSSFQGTSLSGILTAVCLFLAMLTDLWLHPALQVALARRL